MKFDITIVINILLWVFCAQIKQDLSSFVHFPTSIPLFVLSSLVKWNSIITIIIARAIRNGGGAVQQSHPCVREKDDGDDDDAGWYVFAALKIYYLIC